MEHSDSIASLAAALAKAQGAMGPAKMDAVNPFLKNKYADLGSVIQAARPALSANGLSFSQTPTLDAGCVTVTTLLMHASGEWIESAITLPVGDSKGLSLAQSMGAVITYLRRYSLSAVLGIYADEDTDGNEKTPAKSNKPEPVQAPQPAPSAPQQTPAPAVAQSAVIVPVMPYEDTATVSTSDGKAYREIDNSTLAHMANSITKKLMRSGYTTPEEKGQAEYKLSAIRSILAHDGPAVRLEL